MGSSTSKPRRGHKKTQHLAKVGSPQNQEWERETRAQRVFGPGVIGIVVGVIIVLMVIGLIALTA